MVAEQHRVPPLWEHAPKQLCFNPIRAANKPSNLTPVFGSLAVFSSVVNGDFPGAMPSECNAVPQTSGPEEGGSVISAFIYD